MNKLFLIFIILLSSKYTINEDSNYDYSSYASKINHTFFKNSRELKGYDIINNKTDACFFPPARVRERFPVSPISPPISA